MASTEETVYDIIFAGGGASACITAGRLAAADPSLKILIVEAGPHTHELKEHIQPGRYFSNMPRKEVFTYHESNASPALLGRSLTIPSGCAVGGGSAVNFLVYTRAAASDYDDWETVYGNRGWGSNYLIPLLKKAETYQPGSNNDTHGTSGPIKVSYASDSVNVAENFLEVAAAIDKERGSTDDTNAFFYADKYGRWARYIDEESGRRSDAAHYYIYNQAANTNLQVLDRHRVVKVIFEGDRAVGIEFVSDTVGRSGGTTSPIVARASRLVVVSAGAFGSPVILERSGIGAKSVLEKCGVEQRVDLPGVGEHYRDHNGMFLSFAATEDADTLDQLFQGAPEEVATYEQQWLKNGKGFMAHNGIDGGIKMRPNAEELASMSPEFDQRWNSYFANAPDKPVMLHLLLAGRPGAEAGSGCKYFTIGYFSGYPVSLGYVHITSGTDPYAKSDFYAGFLDDDADLVILRWGYKKSRELARRMKYYAGDVNDAHPSFKPDSKAATIQSNAPAALAASDIVYSKEDDDAIDEYHRRTVQTTWHSIGTCAMKPRDQGGVVDERLNVYGVEGLKIADCSIAPGNVGANTYNTAIAIGEKAAVIIAEDLGIKGISPFPAEAKL